MMNRFFPPYGNAPAGDDWIPLYVSHKLAEDLNHETPDIGCVENVETCGQSGNSSADLGAYFNTFPDFNKAWRHYALIGSFDFMAVPEDYVRAHYTGMALEGLLKFNANHPGKCLFDIYKRQSD
jgi:hypothetical protein